MKTRAIIRLTIWSLLALALIGLIVSGMLRNGGLFGIRLGIWDGKTMPNVGSSQVDAAAVSRIHLEWVAGEVRIQRADVRQIQFSEPTGLPEKKQLRWGVENGTLTIQYWENMKGFTGLSLGKSDSKDLTLLVPRDWTAEEIEVDYVSAQLIMTDITTDRLELAGVSGICELTNFNCSDLNLETVSGDVTMSGSARTLDFEGVSARLTAQFTQCPQSMEMETVSGDLEVALPQGSGFTCKLDSLSGGFSSNVGCQVSKSTYSYGDRSCRISISGVSGSATVNIAE